MNDLFNWDDIKFNKFEEKNRHCGYVSIIFKTTDTWSAGVFYDTEQEDTFKFIAYFRVMLDEDVVFIGKWQDNTYRGETSRQFVAEYVEKNLQFTQDGLYRFLKNNPDIKGIGDKKAKAISEKYWSNFDDVISNTPHLIEHDLKIKKDIINNLQKIWIKNKHANLVTVALSEFPLTQSIISKIIESYGANSVDIVKKNPYALIPFISGYNFKTADGVALFLGWKPESKERIEAAIIHILLDEIQNGYDGSHCWIEINELIEYAIKLLDIDASYITSYIKNDLKEDEIKLFEHDDILKVSHSYVFYQEDYAVKYIVEIKDNSLIRNGSEVYQLYKDDLDILNEKQKQCITNALNYDFSIITGKAGTGKTFVIKYLLHIFKNLSYSVCLLAPTGKAARRMTESTGYKASTIHKILGYNSLEYTYHEHNKIYDYDVYIVDEFSMINNNLAYRLFCALPDNVKVIIVGDHNQLPPIGPGLLFNHLLFCKKYNYHITELSDIVRQAGNLKTNSVKILNSEMNTEQSDDWNVLISEKFDSHEIILELLLDNLEKSEDAYGFQNDDIQVITPMKKGVIGVHNLNICIQEMIQRTKYGIDVEPVKNIERPKFYLHDRVVQMANDYDIDVMNGTLGKIIYYNTHSGSMKIKFENDKIVEYEKNSEKLDNVTLAYALTIHKTQGSEFPCVVVLLHHSQYIMLNKNLLYTAVTRAKNKLFLMANKKAVNIALSHINTINKKTNYDYIIENIN